MKITFVLNDAIDITKLQRSITEEDADGAHACGHGVVHVRQHQPLRHVQKTTTTKNQIFSDDADLQQTS